MSSLNVKPPTVTTRVTEYMPEILDYIQKIIDNGFAYSINGSVYFDTEKYSKSHCYGKLGVSNSEELNEGEGNSIQNLKKANGGK
jgi:cysteinyl-tRNA synthetase